MTETTFERPTVAQLRTEAEAIVSKTPPGDVLLALFLGIFHVIFWIIGRAWWLFARLVVMIVVAGKYGYWQGAKVPAEQRVKKQAPQQPRQ